MVEIEDRGVPGLDIRPEMPVHPRTGEKRAMYLSRKELERHGYTYGCTGCRDLASGRKGPIGCLAPHTTACRRRMEEAIRVTDPRRWENYQRRRGEMDASHEPAAGAEESADGDQHAGSGRGDEGDGAPSGPSPFESRIPESGLIHRLCSVDVAEVFSPPRVSSEAAKFGLMAGEAMDLTTGWAFNRKED